jgi:hypothetical protein
MAGVCRRNSDDSVGTWPKLRQLLFYFFAVYLAVKLDLCSRLPWAKWRAPLTEAWGRLVEAPLLRRPLDFLRAILGHPSGPAGSLEYVRYGGGKGMEMAAAESEELPACVATLGPDPRSWEASAKQLLCWYHHEETAWLSQGGSRASDNAPWEGWCVPSAHEVALDMRDWQPWDVTIDESSAPCVALSARTLLVGVGHPPLCTSEKDSPPIFAPCLHARATRDGSAAR